MSEKINLIGLTRITGVMAFLATKDTHVSGAHRVD